MASCYKISVIDAIVRTDGKKSHTVYKIKVEKKSGGTWVIYRRYSQFHDLNQKITKKYATQNFALPKKKIVGNLKAEFIESRRVSLHRYMQRVLQHPIACKSAELEEFLVPGDGDEPMEQSTKAPEASAPASDMPEGMKDDSDKIGIEDFSLLKVIGKGSFGKVMLAKKKDTEEIFAIKILDKKAVVQKGELDHVRSERNVLVNTMQHPFLVSMHYSFQSPDKLFFVMDYVNGGEMFYHLQRDKRFSEERVRFYSAEIALAIGHLHSVGIVYRDLKPENILIGADGHIVLTDFGLCKEGIGFGDSTRTFCGTPEYLAPEVLRSERHGLPVDWWCLGIVTYEMLTGLPPFYSEDRDEMYQRTLREEVYYPSYISKSAKTLLVGLLQRQPAERLCSGEEDVGELKRQAFFASINWEKLYNKKVKPPWLPKVKSKSDVSNIDNDFLSEPVNSQEIQGNLANASATDQDGFNGFTYSANSHIAKAAASD